MTVGVEVYPPQPALSVNFLCGALDSRLSFARASNAWSYNAAGILTQASTNIPRFDYDPSSLALRGLLVEEQRTNLVKYSADLTQSIQWAYTAASVANVAQATPDGGATASKITITTANAYRVAATGITVTPGAVYVFSFWALKGTATNLQYSVYDQTHAANVIYLSGDYASTLSASVWTRIAVSFTAPAGCTAVTVYPTRDATVTGTVFFWGCQLESGMFATSYIPTAGSTATRAADRISTTGLGWFNAASGAFAVQARALGLNSAAANDLVSFSDGTTANNLALFVNSSGNAQGGATISSTACLSAATAGSPGSGTIFKQGLGYNAGTNAVAYDGSVDGAGTLAAATVPAGISRLDFAAREDGTLTFNGWLQKFTYWNYRPTNAQLQTVTT